jgi:hypothetical protein
MSQGGPAEIPAAVTVAIGFDWPGVFYMCIVPQSQGAFFRKSKGVSSVSGWQDTIEHIDSRLDGGNDIRRRAHTHKVAGFILR